VNIGSWGLKTGQLGLINNRLTRFKKGLAWVGLLLGFSMLGTPLAALVTERSLESLGII
jgi:hypothetical protein